MPPQHVGRVVVDLGNLGALPAVAADLLEAHPALKGLAVGLVHNDKAIGPVALLVFPGMRRALDIALAALHDALVQGLHLGQIAGAEEPDAGGIAGRHDRQRDLPFAHPLDHAIAEVLVKGYAEGHEGRDELVPLAGLVQDLLHDGTGDAGLVAVAAAAVGADGPDPRHALAGDGRAAHPHGQRQAGGGADGLAIFLGDQPVAVVLAAILSDAGLEILQVTVAHAEAPHPCLGDLVQLIWSDPAQFQTHGALLACPATMATGRAAVQRPSASLTVGRGGAAGCGVAQVAVG